MPLFVVVLLKRRIYNKETKREVLSFDSLVFNSLLSLSYTLSLVFFTLSPSALCCSLQEIKLSSSTNDECFIR